MALAVFGMTSCSKEGDPEFEFTDPSDTFKPKDTDSEAIAKLRQDFQNEYGTYLLFNDTLQHTYLGKDINGDDKYFTELLDIKYQVGQTSSSTKTYTYTNLNSYEKCAEAVDYLKKYILPHLSKNLNPFSWYLTSIIHGKTSSGNDLRPYAVSGQRSVVLSCKYLPQLKTEEKKKQLAKRHLLIVAQALATNYSSQFADFTAVSSKYYGTNFENFGTGDDGIDDTERVRQKGFINFIANTYYPELQDDINAYTSLVMSYNDDQIAVKYAAYPLIVKKAKMFRQDLINLGYIF